LPPCPEKLPHGCERGLHHESITASFHDDHLTFGGRSSARTSREVLAIVSTLEQAVRWCSA
jgi:hypothetical protein